MNLYWVFSLASTLFFFAGSVRSWTVSPSVHLQSTLLVLLNIHSSMARHLAGQESAEALEKFRRTLQAPPHRPTANPVQSVVDLYHTEESNFHYQKHLDHLKQYQFHSGQLKNRDGGHQDAVVPLPKMAVTKKLQTHQQQLFHESLASHQHDQHEGVEANEVNKELSDLEKSLELLQLLGDFSPRDDTPSVPSTNKSNKHVDQPTDLACQDFICLLAKYDLLKTDKGYVLTLDERPSRSNATARCADFACWMSQFIVRKKTYGFELVQKGHVESDLAAKQSKADQSEADFAKIFQLGALTGSVASTPTPVMPPMTIPVPESDDYSAESFWSLFGQAQSSQLIPDRAPPPKAKTPPQSVVKPYKVDYGSLFGDYDYSENY